MKEALAIESQGRKVMSIATFGSLEGRRQSCERLESAHMTVLTGSWHCCQYVNRYRIPGYIKGYPHLRNLNFMELSEDTAQRGPDRM